MLLRALVLAVALSGLGLGCGGSSARPDAGFPVDAAVATDGGVHEDGGTVDGGVEIGDAGAPDAGLMDGGALDGGPPDGGADAGVPETTIISGPQGATPSTDATFSFLSTVAGASFECSLDGRSSIPCTSPKTYTNLAEGPHTFAVFSRAGALTDTTPATRSWTADVTAPETTIASGPGAQTSEYVATFTFSASEAGISYECQLDTAAYSPCTTPWVLTEVRTGMHTLNVRATDAAGNIDTTPASWSWEKTAGSVRLRIMAANITSGNRQSYDPGEGIRIFQGLKPDVVLIQELNYGDSSTLAIRGFVNLTFGESFEFYREPETADIPNGIISRYPIRSAGVWTDPLTSTRGFVWARIDIPGPTDLWAVSVHLLTSSADSRNREAQELVTLLQDNVPGPGYLAVGGDFNTDERGESCISTLSTVLVTDPDDAPYPVDQLGNSNTNTSRTKPYDWLLVDDDLNPLGIALEIGASSYPTGLVFDSRVYTPLSEVAPVLLGDSGASNMQHMAVVRDFSIPH